MVQGGDLPKPSIPPLEPPPPYNKCANRKDKKQQKLSGSSDEVLGQIDIRHYFTTVIHRLLRWNGVDGELEHYKQENVVYYEMCS